MMVSENLFNETLISNEQKSSSSILECSNFDEKMAQVDISASESSPLLRSSPPHTNGDDKSEIRIQNGTTNGIDGLQDDNDILTSDIELALDDFDDKDAPSESEDTMINGNTSVDHEPTLVLNRDIESVESLDIDLSNTANLVGRRFLQDDFDSANSLDSVDEALSKLPIDEIIRNGKEAENCVPNSSSFTARLQQGVSFANQKALESELSKDENNVVKSNIEHDDTSKLLSEIKTAESVADEELTKIKLEKDTEEDLKSKTKCSESEPSTESPKTDDISIPAKTDLDSEPREVVPTENCTETVECNPSEKDDEMEVGTVEDTVSEPEPVEKVSQSKTFVENVLAEPIVREEIEPEAVLEHSEIQPSSEPQNENTLNQNNADMPKSPSPPHPFQIDDNFMLQVETAVNTPQVESTKNVSNEPQPISSIDDTVTLDVPEPEKRTASNHVDSCKNDDSTLQDCQITENTSVPENENAQMQISEIADKPSSPVHEINIQSPSTDHVDVQCDEPRSVDSTEIQVIDLVEPEIPGEPVVPEVVDLDAPDEPMEQDQNPGVNKPTLKVLVEQCSREEKEHHLSPTSENLEPKQLAESTTEKITTSVSIPQQDENDIDMEIASDSTAITNDLISEMCTTETEIPLSILNSFLDIDNRKRKCDDSIVKNQSSEIIVEKRLKVSDELKTSDIDKENRTVTSNNDSKKKSSVNIARKHTSSTSVAKTVKEIEKKIKDDIVVRSRSNSREPTPLNDFDQFDIILNESVAENIEINNCDDVLRNVDNSAHRISLNFDVISEENLRNIFKMMRTKLTRRQLEEIVIQKCCEMISDSGEIGELRKQVSELQQAEFYRKQKILNLEKQIHQLKAVCQRYIDQVKETKGDKTQINPIKITRSVGLQVAIDSTPHIQPEPSSSNRQEDRLKKLLSAPAPNKKASLEERRETPSPRHIAAGSPNLNKNTDPKVINNNYGEMNGRVSSPLCNGPVPCTSPSSIPSRGSIFKKNIKPTSDSNVIDLTDKDDKIDNEANVAANNLLASVNGGTVVTYVPVRMNQDQNRQTIKPGTQLIVNGQLMTVQGKTYPRGTVSTEHPAPVPVTPAVAVLTGTKPLPPKPTLRIAKNGNGIMLSWSMPEVPYAKILKYQLYAYQETNIPPAVDLWKAVGDVDALPLPMACTLTQFVEGYRYHFIVRAVDVHHRIGPFSSPESIIL